MSEQNNDYSTPSKAGWVLLILTCGLSLVPVLGFGAWIIAAPMLIATFALAIVVLSKGGTVSGIFLLLGSVVVAPVFVFCAPIISTMLGIGAAASATSAAVITTTAALTPPSATRESPDVNRAQVERDQDHAALTSLSSQSDFNPRTTTDPGNIEIRRAFPVTPPSQPKAEGDAQVFPSPESSSAHDRPVVPANSRLFSNQENLKQRQDFLDSWLYRFVEAGDLNEPEQEVRFYSDAVYLFDEGRVDQARLLKDLRAYQKRWPNRKTTVENSPVVAVNDAGNTWSIEYKTSFEASDGSKFSKGRANSTVQGRMEAGLPLVTSLNQTILERQKGELGEGAKPTPSTHPTTVAGASDFEAGEALVRGGHEEDCLRAVAAFVRASDLGHPGAMHRLGVMYATGNGLPKDERKAVEYYRKSAENGFAEAQFDLGVRYILGRGIPKDEQAGIGWYKKAAQQGYQPASDALRQRRK